MELRGGERRVYDRRRLLRGLAVGAGIGAIGLAGLNTVLHELSPSEQKRRALEEREANAKSDLVTFKSFIDDYINKLPNDTFWSTFEEFSRKASIDELEKRFMTISMQADETETRLHMLFWPQDVPVTKIPSVQLFVYNQHSKFDNAVLRSRLGENGKVNPSRDDVIWDNPGFHARNPNLTRDQMIDSFARFVKDPRFKSTEWSEPFAPDGVIECKFEDTLKDTQVTVGGMIDRGGFMQLSVRRSLPVAPKGSGIAV